MSKYRGDLRHMTFSTGGSVERGGGQTRAMSCAREGRSLRDHEARASSFVQRAQHTKGGSRGTYFPSLNASFPAFLAFSIPLTALSPSRACPDTTSMNQLWLRWDVCGWRAGLDTRWWSGSTRRASCKCFKAWSTCPLYNSAFPANGLHSGATQA